MGKYERGLPLIEKIKKGIEQFSDKMDKNKIFVFYYLIAELYFYMQDYNSSQQWLNKLLNEKYLESFPYIYSSTKLFNIVIHYELGNELLLESLIRSARRSLDIKNRLYKFENLLLDFFSKISRKPHVKISQQEFFSLKAKLENLSKNNFEREPLQYFDFISWADSKIRNKPLRQIAGRAYTK